MKYSAWALFREGLYGHRRWPKAWRASNPEPHYDVVIIGGGGHGLATAFYLAKNHNIRRIAVLERGWIGSGNIGRNTTIIRSNYMLVPNTYFYEHSMQLWESLEKQLNFNAMVSQRGIFNLFHSDTERDAAARRGNAMRLAGVDAYLLDTDQIRTMVPQLDFDNARFPIKGALYQPRAGTVRHDAVAWGYARAASSLGVDIIENCEVTGFDCKSGAVLGVETSRGFIRAEKIGMAVA